MEIDFLLVMAETYIVILKINITNKNISKKQIKINFQNGINVSLTRSSISLLKVFHSIDY